MLSVSAADLSFEDMNLLAEQAPVGSEGLLFYPFGNGAERILEGRLAGADLRNLDFNIHGPSHLIRAGKEGIVFALNLGFDILTDMGVPCNTIKAGRANLFLSKSFQEIFANVTQTVLQIYDTDGAEGAARGAALGAGYYADTDQAFDSLELIEEIEPTPDLVNRYGEIYESWKQNL
jgi:xylulokinase